MSLFGAVRLYVVSADRIGRDPAPPDGGSVATHRTGAWARWAQVGDPGREPDPSPSLSRVEPGPVHLAGGLSARA